MTTFGKVARSIGSVDDINLVDTVDVVNCFTVLKQKQDEIYQDCITRICRINYINKKFLTMQKLRIKFHILYLLQRKTARPAIAKMVNVQKIFPMAED